MLVLYRGGPVEQVINIRDKARRMAVLRVAAREDADAVEFLVRDSSLNRGALHSPE